MEKKLKSWQGWLLFGGSMVVVFVLGLCVSALMERRAEVTSIFRLSSKGLKHATNSLRMISLVNIRLGRKLQKQISKVSLMEMLPLMYWNNVLIW